MFIRKYKDSDFDQLCHVMDRARMQELKTANMEQVFIQLKYAPYLRYLLKCKMYVATKEEKIVGFVGLRPHELSFLYVDPNFQNHGVGKKLIEFALKRLERSIKLDVFTDNFAAKALYEKYGFKVVKTVVEKWSDEYPIEFSQDTMEMK
ncbi:GNAT family N-acetyltransferase [Lactobacillus paragasseri]|uniref:GNAT family N-acetyltransferase n=1 Tax=Lactobacillus paragasseri TaxID=2107999 RepID=A0ABD4ZYN4_9LACO|nr:GNAT family N-acetyltransferase [Lactobacillus paragasseri]MDK7951976.1 GNAT family N-acetyltransferase [Lactobacillus paragasseri]MDO6360631.1 GNAT family N-acetyltransferase [Lactobacillus paragasseri]MDX5059352.1 GNAT family N-acetyltransferase [Lactobacillus paragasseri]